MMLCPVDLDYYVTSTSAGLSNGQCMQAGGEGLRNQDAFTVRKFHEQEAQLALVWTDRTDYIRTQI